MKYRIMSTFLLIMSFNIMAQRVRSIVLTEEQKKQEIREKINLDYSVPDYNVNRPDAKVMAWRLAKILQSLEKNYTQPIYNQMLSQIRSVQTGGLKVRYSHVDKSRIPAIPIIIYHCTHNVNIVDLDYNYAVKTTFSLRKLY